MARLRLHRQELLEAPVEVLGVHSCPSCSIKTSHPASVRGAARVGHALFLRGRHRRWRRAAGGLEVCCCCQCWRRPRRAGVVEPVAGTEELVLVHPRRVVQARHKVDGAGDRRHPRGQRLPWQQHLPGLIVGRTAVQVCEKGAGIHGREHPCHRHIHGRQGARQLARRATHATGASGRGAAALLREERVLLVGLDAIWRHRALHLDPLAPYAVVLVLLQRARDCRHPFLAGDEADEAEAAGPAGERVHEHHSV
mmetsp:Transcript_37615/g.106259  ORF Transcript_37615/g.106259 Transcript_37615/m.106259 type:complete len:253 (+) Transcript_37615:688-1446(+)